MLTKILLPHRFQNLRLDSILFACYGYFTLNIVGTILIDGSENLSFLFFNMVSIPVLLILRFRLLKYRQSKKPTMAL